jgi:hypothetical protein
MLTKTNKLLINNNFIKVNYMKNSTFPRKSENINSVALNASTKCLINQLEYSFASDCFLNIFENKMWIPEQPPSLRIQFGS